MHLRRLECIVSAFDISVLGCIKSNAPHRLLNVLHHSMRASTAEIRNHSHPPVIVAFIELAKDIHRILSIR